MKLMIDIPDSFYSDLKENRVDLGTIGCQLLLNKVKNAVPCGDMGEVSDGYHTFNQLYHQRAILFAAIVNQNKGIAWKSYKHSDGKYCFDSNGEWFIVGIDTPEGSYTYHYSKEYWDYFKCKELDCGKEWDGHTEEDVTRLLSLEQEPCEELDFVQPHKKVSVNLEPCTDAISRLAVLNLAKFDGRDGLGSIIHAFDVEQLPPVNPAEKQEHCEDAISRQAVIEVIEKCHCEEWVKADIGAPIEALQSVTPTEKVGHWILLDDCSNSGYYCSECHKRVVKEGWSDTVKIIKYCPNCGAKMQGVEE